jgi:hypothetical protein
MSIGSIGSIAQAAAGITQSAPKKNKSEDVEKVGSEAAVVKTGREAAEGSGSNSVAEAKEPQARGSKVNTFA